MTSKERAFLRSCAHPLEPVLHVGKEGVTPLLTEAVSEALAARELIKIGVLKNCFDDIRDIAEIIAERTGSAVVQTMGRKITLYKMKKKDSQFNIRV